MKDNYMHIDGEGIYVSENIPGPMEQSKEYEKLLDNFNSQLDSCKCDQICSEACKCLQKSGGENYKKHNEVLILNNKLNNGYPIVECNKECTCSDSCQNRLVQKGPIEGLIVKKCEVQIKGLGLFTKDFIHKGTFICEYAGELLTKSQAVMRQKWNHANGKMNYVFCLNEHCSGVIIQTFVDPSFLGNVGKYINHSCEPNCCVIPVRCDSPIPKLAIFAQKDILPGSEISFHYGTLSEDRIEHSINENRKKCSCNSERCKGTMPYDIF